MQTCNNILAIVAVGLTIFAWGCGQVNTKVFQPKPLEGLKEVSPSGNTEKLDSEANAFFRNRYTIVSAHYYKVPAELPWIAVSKSVSNQMADKSIQRKLFEWYKLGVDFFDVYPQGNNTTAFALAMPKETNFNAEKLVAFYVLKANTPPE